ncbi:type II and III secretion system protein family protein [Robbsia sp. KACC 23696]|uniref:type II and III secretion system protein family protein n=1 Tax=Robbsia sp. KACC 23696 TaxID=3149231 RepID=UPI00325AAF0D
MSRPRLTDRIKKGVRAVTAGYAQCALHVENRRRRPLQTSKGAAPARRRIAGAAWTAMVLGLAVSTAGTEAQTTVRSATRTPDLAPMSGSAPVSDLTAPAVTPLRVSDSTPTAAEPAAGRTSRPRQNATTARQRTLARNQHRAATQASRSSGAATGAVVAAGAVLSQSAPDPLPFAMVVSEQRILPAAQLTRVAVGDSAVADVQPITGGILIVAKKPGATRLSIWERNRTAPREVAITVRALSADALLSNTGGSVQVYGDTAVLSGQMASAADHQAALAVAQQSGAKVLDRSTVGTGGVVQVDVKVVEFSKSVLKEAGFNLFSTRSNGFGFGVFGPSQLSTYSPSTTGVSFGSSVGTNLASAFNLVAGPFANGLFGNLSIMETNGLARVLAEPTLVALSGQSASFLAGGELPVPQSGGLGTTTIVYKQFGVGLTVTPTVLGPGQIALKVAPEASDLDYTHAITESGISIPAITTRRADTTVQLGDGESFIIGGLVSRSTVASVNKVPLLGDLPIIGVFFKNLSYTQDDRELVILVTPHLVKPIAKGVALPLPGAGRDSSTQPVWGSFLRGPGSGNDVPGFSR